MMPIAGDDLTYKLIYPLYQVWVYKVAKEKSLLEIHSFLIFKLRVANPPTSTCSTVKSCLPSNANLMVLCGDSSNLYKDGFHSLITNLPSTYTLTASSHVTPNS